MTTILTFLSRLVAVVALVLVTHVWGHGIELFARVEAGEIVGFMKSPDGTPFGNATVRALDAAGVVLNEAKTDAAGNFRMEIRRPVAHQILGDGGHGHVGRHTIPLAEIEAGMTPSPSREGGGEVVANADLEAAIARQIGPLRDQLHAHEARVRLRDILGGIGYVFGLAGIYVLLRQRNLTKPSEPES